MKYLIPYEKNGNIYIPNDLIDSLIKINITGQGYQIFNYILFATYRQNKPETTLTLKDISEGTGINVKNINRTINKLLNMNMISKTNNVYSINIHHNEWGKDG